MINFPAGFDFDLAKKACSFVLLTPQEKGIEYISGRKVNKLSHNFQQL